MKPTKPILYITGYGPFMQVTENPSATIAQRVAERMEQSGQAQVFHETLGVNLDAVSAYFSHLRADVAAKLDAHPEQRVLLVNVGLCSREKGKLLRLEVRGFNELEGKPIDEELPMDACRDSAFVKGCRAEATAALLQELNAARRSPGSGGGGGQGREGNDDDGSRWIVSHDAGRYYCNYALYSGVKVQEASNDRMFAVFLHIVDFRIVGMDEQVAQVQALVSRLLGLMELDE